MGKRKREIGFAMWSRQMRRDLGASTILSVLDLSLTSEERAEERVGSERDGADAESVDARPEDPGEAPGDKERVGCSGVVE